MSAEEIKNVGEEATAVAQPEATQEEVVREEEGNVEMPKEDLEAVNEPIDYATASTEARESFMKEVLETQKASERIKLVDIEKIPTEAEVKALAEEWDEANRAFHEDLKLSLSEDKNEAEAFAVVLQTFFERYCQWSGDQFRAVLAIHETLEEISSKRKNKTFNELKLSYYETMVIAVFLKEPKGTGIKSSEWFRDNATNLYKISQRSLSMLKDFEDRKKELERKLEVAQLASISFCVEALPLENKYEHDLAKCIELENKFLEEAGLL